jgi:amino acid permease
VGFFTQVTTNVRTKRAAVVLFAVAMVGLLAYAHFVLVPLVEEGGRAEGIEQKGFSGACFEAARRGTWLLPVIGCLAIVLVVLVSRGRLDDRLMSLSMWLFVAYAFLLAFYLVAFWWYYGSYYSK